jgi:Na+/H+ antiporter NhaA
VWASASYDSYQATWATTRSVRISDAGVGLDLRTWVNSGLMALYFFVVGLEARREFDMGGCVNAAVSPFR